jgi:hypothetical protein
MATSCSDVFFYHVDFTETIQGQNESLAEIKNQGKIDF